MVLAIMVGLGVIITSYAQGMGDRAGAIVHVSKKSEGSTLF